MVEKGKKMSFCHFLMLRTISSCYIRPSYGFHFTHYIYFDKQLTPNASCNPLSL